CHEFIAYENLTRSRRSESKGGRPTPAPSGGNAPVAQAFSLVRRALKILADREVSPQTGLLKSTLLQLDSTFSERNYGASSFLDFVEKLAQAGVVQLKHAGRSVMVELTEHAGGFDDQQRSAPPAGGAEEATGDEAPPQAYVHDAQPTVAAPQNGAEPQAAPPQAGSQADGVRIVGAILRQAQARWPMYLRNVKQILRQHRAEGDGTGFDERRYGFGGLIDLLRACQREGFVRLERDRRGGLRVFQGAALQHAGGPSMPLQPMPAPEPIETAPGGMVDTREAD